MSEPNEPGWWWCIHRDGQRWRAVEVQDFRALGLFVSYCDGDECSDIELAVFIGDGWSFGPRIYPPAPPRPGDETPWPEDLRCSELPHG